MAAQTSEKAFETHVEEVLLQKCGWHPGTNAEWDVERTIFPARIQETPPVLWEQMRVPNGDGVVGLLTITAAVTSIIDVRGAVQ